MKIKRRVVSAIAWLGILVSALSAFAHSPHDEVRAIVLSPNFGQDGIAFAVVRRPPSPHSAALLRTTNGGLFWKRITNGMDYRGEVTDVCLSPNFSTDGTAFMTTDTNGAYVSRDGGLSFVGIGQGMPFSNGGVAACAVDDQSRQVVVVAGRYGGLARSDDLGVTWTTLVPTSLVITALETSPNVVASGAIVAGTEDGDLYLSTDYGRSWALSASLAGAGAIHEVAITSPGSTTFVATDAIGLQRSIDGGQSFTPVNTGLASERVTALAVSPNFATDQTVFAATEGAGVFRSTNAGDSWLQFENGIVLHSDAAIQTDYHYQRLAVSESYGSDGTVFVAMFEGIFRSTDSGENWLQLESVSTASLMGLALSPQFGTDGTLAVARYGGGAGISKDGGGTWAPLNRGLDSPFVYDVAFSTDYANDLTLFGIAPRYLKLRSTDAGTTWSLGSLLEQLQGTHVRVSPNYVNDQTVFLGSRADGIFRTTDGGASWTQVFFDYPTRVDSVEITPNYETAAVVFAGRRTLGVLKSTDGGTTWLAANNGLALDAQRGPRLAISPDYASDNRIYAATLQGLYLSANAGESWSALTIDGAPQIVPIEAVALSPDFAMDGMMLASTRGHGLFKSSDRGASWLALAPSLLTDSEQFQAIWFSPAFAQDETVFAYSSSRLFRSTDGGESWIIINHGPVRYENHAPRDEALLYEGTGVGVVWTEASAKRVTWMQSGGSRARFHFNGTGFRWLGVRGDFLGMADVIVDGVYKQTVDLYSTSIEPRATLYLETGLSHGFHEVEIVVTGNKHPASSGIGIAVDGIDYMP